MWRGRLSLRRLNVLITNLPPGSALERASGDGWSVDRHLTAHVLDTLRQANWQRAGDPKAKCPDPIPRPGETEQSQARIRANAEAFRARQRRSI